MRHLLPVCGVLGLLSGCGSSEPPPAPLQKTVFDPMLQARDKAQNVADKLPAEHKESLDKAIDSDSN
jgi:hypothetical protein